MLHAFFLFASFLMVSGSNMHLLTKTMQTPDNNPFYIPNTIHRWAFWPNMPLFFVLSSVNPLICHTPHLQSPHFLHIFDTQEQHCYIISPLNLDKIGESHMIGHRPHEYVHLWMQIQSHKPSCLRPSGCPKTRNAETSPEGLLTHEGNCLNQSILNCHQWDYGRCSFWQMTEIAGGVTKSVFSIFQQGVQSVTSETIKIQGAQVDFHEKV